MEELNKSNQLFLTLDLFSKLRMMSKSAMCTKAGVSPGIISDLKRGRKQTIQIETASKMAKALDTTVSAIESNKLCAANWSGDETSRWEDCDDDIERLSFLRNHGVDVSVMLKKENRRFLDRVIMENPEPYENKKNPTGKADEVNLSDMELLAAFKQSDDATQELIRRALGLK